MSRTYGPVAVTLLRRQSRSRAVIARYGFDEHFRSPPLMPNQVYRFDPDTGAVHVVADGFDRCNGIAFAPDGKTAFMYVPSVNDSVSRLTIILCSTDTGLYGGFLGYNQTLPATM